MDKMQERLLEVAERTLKAQSPEGGLPEGSNVWDVLLAPKGITLILGSGQVIPVRMSEGAAKTLHHSWTVEAEKAS